MKDYLVILVPFITAVVVAIIQNIDKLNPNTKRLKEIQKTQKAHQEDLAAVKNDVGSVRNDVAEVKQDVENVRSDNAKNRNTLRSIRQHQIADLSEKIQAKVVTKDDSCKTDFIHIVDSYKEYHEDGFNSAGTRWFEDAFRAMLRYDRSYALSVMQSEYPEYSGVIPDIEMMKV